MIATRFRKRPLVVEAFQMTRERREDNADWPDWLHRAWNREPGVPGAVGCLKTVHGDLDPSRRLVICTLEGEHLVEWGDWIVRGVRGELYPCKPDIFEQTYEAVP